MLKFNEIDARTAELFLRNNSFINQRCLWYKFTVRNVLKGLVMNFQPKLLLTSLAILSFSSMSEANKSTSTSTSQSIIHQSDKTYNHLVTELKQASSGPKQLLKLQNFTAIKVTRESTRIEQNQITEEFNTKSYATCASDNAHGFSYDVKANWSKHNQMLEADKQTAPPEWILTSYQAKRRSSPCKA